MLHSAWKLIACLTLILLAQARVEAQNDITYVYDESGRLVVVISPSGDAVKYTYDAAGNLLSISRQSPALASVLEFTPNTGPVGTEVTIYGTGFSTTAGQNVVKFNGVAAVVSSATSTKLVTKVPSGATTGPISVGSPAGTATSSTSFVVGNSKVPTISGFTPTIGTPGKAITITGTNFRSPLSDNFLKLNVSDSQPTSGTATTLVTNVPAYAGSGRIQVVTAYGKAVSKADFFVPPTPYTAAEVQATGRMTVGTSKGVAIPSINKVGMILFDGAAGQRVSLQFSNVGFSSCQVKIYSPNAALLAETGVGTSGGFLESPVLPADGTYAILVDPDSNYTGSLTMTLNSASDVSVAINANGPPLTVNTSVPGQNARATFRGTAGQRVSLKITDVTASGTNVSLNKPDGTNLAYINVGTGGGFMDTETLPVTGTYSILVDPSNVYTGSATLTLYSVPADVGGSITPGGAAVTVAATVPGQNARLSFSATAGQKISLGLGASSIPGGTPVTLYQPDDTYLYSVYVNQGGDAFIDTQALPVAGTYSILIDPQGSSVGSVALKLYNVADVKGSITAGGASLTLATTSPGQNARATFSGTAGQRVSLKITGVTIPGTNVNLNKPDGTNLNYVSVGADGGFMDTETLPVTGTYTILVDPSDVQTGSVTLTLYRVPADASANIAPGGAAVSVATTVPGQNARFNFNGTAGQVVSFNLWGNTFPDYTYLTLFAPNNTSLGGVNMYQGSDGSFDAIRLPATGAYKILVDPQGAHTGRMTINNPPLATGTITPGGAALSVNINTPGQSAKLTFNGTTGQRVSLAIFNVTIPFAYVYLKRPDGLTLASTTIGVNGNYFIETQTLPMNGTYSILLDPDGSGTGRATFALYNIVDVTGTITPGGAPVKVTTTSPGQRALLTFNATGGQKIFLKINNVTTTNARVVISKPVGQLAETTVTTEGGFIETQTVPSTGTYAIVVDPNGTYTGSVTLTLYNVADGTGTIAPGGPPVNVTTTTPGQNYTLTFNGTAGQKILLSLTQVQFPNDAYVYIYRPDGVELIRVYASRNQTPLHDVPALPLTGTYTILVDPLDTGVGSLTMALSSAADVVGTLTPDGPPATLTTTSPGQNAKATFSGTAGQRVSLKITGVTVSGTYVNLNKPDGTNLASVFVGAGGGFMDTETLPVTGTYSILVDPSDVQTGSATLTLYKVPADASRSITPGGASVTVTTTVPGQNARLSFSATAGQKVSLGLGAMFIPDATQIVIYGPDGTSLGSTISVYQGQSGFMDTETLPVTGTYTILVDPQDAHVGSATATLYNSPDVTGTITVGGAAVRSNINTPGQNGRLTFSGTAGWKVSFNLSQVTVPDSTSVTIYRPDGSQLASTSVYQGQTGLIATQTLPLTGTYTIMIDPAEANIGGVTVKAVKH